MFVKASSESGISLVEVVVALMLLTVALMGLAAGFAPSRMVIQMGNQVTTASGLARQTLESMRNRAYDSDTDELTGGNFPNQAYGAITNFPGFKRTITIENDTPVTDTKRVTVNVAYKDVDGVERSVNVVTIFVRST